MEMDAAAVLAFRLGRHDYQMLTTKGFIMTPFIAAKYGFQHISKRTKADTKIAAEAAYVEEKRKLITKLLELREEHGQEMRSNPTLAGTAVAASTVAADQKREAALKETARYSRKMQRLLGQQGEDLTDLAQVSKLLGAADAALAPNLSPNSSVD